MDNDITSAVHNLMLMQPSQDVTVIIHIINNSSYSFEIFIATFRATQVKARTCLEARVKIEEDYIMPYNFPPKGLG